METEFKANLGYKLRPFLKKKRNKKNMIKLHYKKKF